LSIGTGDAPGGSFEGSLKTVVDRLKEIALDAERTSDTFFETHSEMARAKRLFRFNVPGLGVVGLEEYKMRATIASYTDTYLERPQTVNSLTECVKGLAAGNDET
jgi:hypothetical protein